MYRQDDDTIWTIIVVFIVVSIVMWITGLLDILTRLLGA